MAKTFRASWFPGSSQRLSPPPHHAARLPRASRAVDSPNPSTPRQTGGGLDRPPRDSARVAQSIGHPRAVAHHHQTRLASASRDSRAREASLFSEAVDDGGRGVACARLDLSLSRRRSQSLCVSYPQSAHPGLRAGIVALAER